MSNILTSWKEIGHYLGKGVRTVQRWEREAGLPVRRQIKPSPHAVIAISDDLDSWARSRTRGPAAAQAGALQREIALLHAENAELRTRVETIESAVLAMSAAELRRGTRRLPAMRLRLETATPVSLSRTTTPPTGLFREGRDSRGDSRGIRVTAQQGRALAVRARLSFASTLCAVGERQAHDGDPIALRRAQDSALAIRRSLECPGYVPLDELDDLRSLLCELACRIELIAQAVTSHPEAVLLGGV
jgi:hypothetical protein